MLKESPGIISLIKMYFVNLVIDKSEWALVIESYCLSLHPFEKEMLFTQKYT